MKKILILVALTAVAALALMSTAAAGASDRNRDRIPDKWEKRHDLSLKVVQTRRDQDRDGLNNLGEFRAGTDPRDRDSDDDGIRDGKERPGTVKSFDGTTLVISLFGGGTVEGRVTAATEVTCGAEDSATTASRGSGSGGGNHGNDDQGDDRTQDRGDDPGDRDDDQGDNRGNGRDDPGDNQGDDRGNGRDDPGDNHGDDRGNGRDDPGDNQGDDRGNGRDDRDERSCPAGALKAGAVVKEAELRATRDGLVYEEIELAA